MGDIPTKRSMPLIRSPFGWEADIMRLYLHKMRICAKDETHWRAQSAISHSAKLHLPTQNTISHNVKLHFRFYRRGIYHNPTYPILSSADWRRILWIG